MKLGLFGGTFDPVHCGHIDVARAARAALALDRVWLVPSRVPPHRAAPLASASHRFAMAAMAVASEDALQVSDIEMDAPGASYTIETLDRLHALGIAPAAVHLVTGADAFRDVPTWKGYPQLLDRCHFVVVSRPGHPAPALRDALPALRNRMVEPSWQSLARPSIFLVDVPTAAVSSTDVRRAIKNGDSLTSLVPAAVAAHIARHELYVTVPQARTAVSENDSMTKTPSRPRKRTTSKRPSTELTNAVAAATDKKALDVVVLDLRKAAAFTDYFLICTGANTRQVQAIAEAVREAVARKGSKPSVIEGARRGDWILIDYFDFVVHIFTPATREFYGLERLWGDAERVEIPA